MYYSRGFSFIEIILVLALSSIVILIFIQNISLHRKFLNSNPQDLFYNKTNNYIRRGIKSNQDFLEFDLQSSVGKRDCFLDNVEYLQNIIIPQGVITNNGEVTAMNLAGNLLFVSMNSATSSNPDIIVVDVSSWKVLASLNTGPGIAGMALQGHYLYLANTSVNAQFQVVDVLNPSAPFLVTSLKIQGSASSISKLNPIVTSISTKAINGKARIYIGSQKSNLGEIFIADFDGKTLSYVTSYDTGSIVNDVFADGSGLWATSPSDNELFHYNATGTLDYVFDAEGQSGNGKRIDMLGSDLKMLGRTFGHDELVQIDGITKKIGGGINDLLIGFDSKGKIYILILANVSGVSLLQIWKTKLTDTGVLLDGLAKSVVLPVNASRMVCDSNKIIIGTSSSSVPFIIYSP